MKNKTIFTFTLLLFIIVLISVGYVLKIYPKNTNSINIVALGDSITYGTGDPFKLGYLGRFQEKFEQIKGSSLKINNFGIPKYRSIDLVDQLKTKKVMQKIKTADFIILYVGTNDFRKSANYKFANLDGERMYEGKKAFSNNLHEIFAKIRKQNSDARIIILGLYHPYSEYKNQNKILEEIINWNTEIYSVALEYEPFSYISTLEIFLDIPKKEIFSDSIHPNAKGHQLICNLLLDNIILEKLPQ